MKNRITVFLMLFVVLTSCQTRPSSETGTPSIANVTTNADNIGKYEKFEISLQLNGVDIKNPYDPNEIDLYAEFRSPEGEEVRINGFYDNYEDANTWRIRFAPSVTGKWTFQVFARNKNGINHSEEGAFTCRESAYHGWIRPSTRNPHYLMHDDGTSWYAVGVYSPWRNDDARLNNYVQHKANLLALWDISYGGFVNGTGLIEEELGKYNQQKCGRIDSLLTFFEHHDIKLMFAIWPHDLFSKTVWAHQWDNNPLSKVTEAENVYSDSTAWEYQKMKYRYLIARFAYSRSFGIWELINEMNGTDGWAKGHHQEAYDWVEKAHAYFSENDPYKHPLTASFSGGLEEYRPPLYERVDIPNIHLYEKQGWPMKYPGDTLRSSMYNFAWASKRFWDNFNKPALFGEAGAELAWYKKDDPNYDLMYHNDIWASLASGLAGTPVWWDYTYITDRDWVSLQHLSEFVSGIDFANENFNPADVSAVGCDAFAMVSDQHGFGWLRASGANRLEGKTVSLKIPAGNYQVSWFDTWTGETIKTENVSATQEGLMLNMPGVKGQHPDVAFKVGK